MINIMMVHKGSLHKRVPHVSLLKVVHMYHYRKLCTSHSIEVMHMYRCTRCAHEVVCISLHEVCVCITAWNSVHITAWSLRMHHCMKLCACHYMNLCACHCMNLCVYHFMKFCTSITAWSYVHVTAWCYANVTAWNCANVTAWNCANVTAWIVRQNSIVDMVNTALLSWWWGFVATCSVPV